MALELKDIPEPIGKWLIENSKKNFPTESGTYYHYVEVCRLLQLMKDECVGKESSDELGNCNKPHVSGSGFFEEGRYYKKIKSQFTDEIDCDIFFKCEYIIKKTDAFGIELVVTPGKELFHIHCCAHFNFSEWVQITQVEFIDSTEKYTSQIANRFS